VTGAFCCIPSQVVALNGDESALCCSKVTEMRLWPSKLAVIRLTTHERLLNECTALTVKVNERDEHIRLLSETAVACELKLRQCEADLERARIELAILSSDNPRLRAEHAFITERAAELENQNELLTRSATEAVRKLQEIKQNDYQIIMAQQQLLAGMTDTDPRFYDIYEKCRPFTMTSVERLYALYKSVEYIVSANLDGDFAETGVWRGGSCMLIAETLLALSSSSRRIFLFDTFAGHPQPDADKDIDIWGNRAIDEWQRMTRDGNHDWGYVSLEQVQANLALTGYPTNNLVFVKGMVEETVRHVPSMDKLALLRLDTDWHDSTRASLEYLYPRLVSGGVLIVDDYGHYQGQRTAVDAYLKATGESILLNRIDYSCRLGVKR
jgi:O-methyltransferase